MAISSSLVYLCYLVHRLFSYGNLYADDSPDSGRQKAVGNTRNLTRKLHIRHRKPGPASTPLPQFICDSRQPPERYAHSGGGLDGGPRGATLD